MADFSRMAHRIRRHVRADGVVEEVRLAQSDGTEVEGGRLLSLSPPRVRLRGGEVVDANAYLRTGEVPSVGADVLVIRRGSFVIVLGEVVML